VERFMGLRHDADGPQAFAAKRRGVKLAAVAAYSFRKRSAACSSVASFLAKQNLTTDKVGGSA